MKFLSNADISRQYYVSRSTVTSWTKAAVVNKNNLQIENSGGKTQVLNNTHNHHELSRLKEEGLRYKSKSDFKKSVPSESFYTIFNADEVIDIVNNLQITREICHKYTYKNGGAQIWSDYYYETEKSSNYPTTQKVISLLDQISDYLINHAKNYTKINLIDIGPGNSEAVKACLESLIEIKKFNKYFAIDISKEMLDESEKNIKTWFPNIQHEGIVLDLERVYLGKELSQKLIDPDSLNIFLFLGSSIGNLNHADRALNNIRDVLNVNDLFIYSNTIDRPNFRTSFTYATSKSAIKQNTWILDYLGIQVEECKIEAKYDKSDKVKKLIIRMDKDYLLQFNLAGYEKEIKLYRGEEITLWRHKMTDLSTFQDELLNADLQLCGLLTDPEVSHALIISRVKS